MNILIKFIYISPMRATNRKINRQPVHSPSPDIAAKNKITTTNAPMTEVIKKSRINSLATMGHDLSLEELHKTIIDWEEKYKILERQLNSLLLDNSALKKEISQLQSLLAQNKPVFANPSQQDTETLRDYEGRFARLMEEIRRIQQLLGREKERNQFLQAQNQKIRSLQDSRRDNTEQLNKNFSYIQQTLNLSFQRMKAEHELKARLSLNGLAERMAKIQRNLFSLENTIARSQFRTPKANKETKYDQFSTNPGHRSASLSESRKFARTSILKEDQHDQTFELISQENARLREALSTQKNKAQQPTECLTCPILERRIAQLQMMLESLRRQRQLNTGQLSLKNQLQLSQERQTFRLEDYLRRIRQVKTILNNHEFRQFVYKVNQLINENTSLSESINRLEEEKDVIRKQSKKKEMEDALMISDLKRQNDALRGRVEGQEDQLAKLQILIGQKLKNNGKTQISKVQTDSKIFQRYIQEAIRKLQTLQESIETTLKE